MVSLVDLNTIANLSEQDAASRLKQEGYSELPSTQSQSLWSTAWDMIQDSIFLLLVGGGIIYWILDDLQEALILRHLFSFFFPHSINFTICLLGGALSLLWFELLKLFNRPERVIKSKSGNPI